MLTRLLAITALLLVNGFFVAAEFALVRSRRTRLEAMSRTGDRLARFTLRHLGIMPRLLSVSQFGITVSSLAAGALTERALGEYFAEQLARLPFALELAVRVGIGSTVAIILVTYFHMVFGELVPRSIALSHPEAMARWLTPPLVAFERAVRPMTWVLQESTNATLRLLRQPVHAPEEAVHSPDELLILVEQSEKGGVLQPQDADLIEGVFEFSEKNAREVMTPRTDIDGLPIDASLDDVFRTLVDSQRSRYPVYEESIDNIVGLVLAKDLLPLLREPPPDFSLRDVMRAVHVVPGSREVEDVLADFKRLKEQMAIVLDEYGGTAGVVTMEDLLEEIVGEILDEHDDPIELPEPESPDTVLVPGATHIGELNERFGLSVPDDDYTTIGGFVFGMLGRLPAVGDRVTAGNAVFAVREMDGRRIETLAVDLRSAGDRRADDRAPGS